MAQAGPQEAQQIRIRRLQEGELGPVRALVVETIDSCYGSVYPPRAVEFFKRYHADEQIREDAATGLTVVVHAGQRLVATGTLVGDSVRRVFVLPDEQGRGLGRAVMHVLEEQAAAASLRRLELDASLVAEPFYLALGYEIVARASIDVGGGEQLLYAQMEKPIPPGGPRSTELG